VASIRGTSARCAAGASGDNRNRSVSVLLREDSDREMPGAARAVSASESPRPSTSEAGLCVGAASSGWLLPVVSELLSRWMLPKWLRCGSSALAEGVLSGEDCGRSSRQ